MTSSSGGSSRSSSSFDPGEEELSLSAFDHYIRRGRVNRASELLLRHVETERRTLLDIIWEAAGHLNWKVLNLLICKHGLFECRNADGDTLLHVIISQHTIHDGKQKLQEILRVVDVVTKSVHVSKIINAVNRERKSPLHIACGLDVKRSRQSQVEYIKLLNLLIDAGADVEMEFKDGIKPLHIVHESQWAQEHLISRGANVNSGDRFQRNPFFWALRNPHFPPVQRIPVSAFNRVNYNFNQADYMGNGVIYYVVSRSRFARSNRDVIRLLEHMIRAGADVNAQNRRLQTPFFMIIHKTVLMDLAKCLLSNGADINLCDADGYTVVSLAAMMSKIDYLKLLIPKLSHNFATPTGETLQDLVRYYIVEEDIDDELRSLLNTLNAKSTVVTRRTYKRPYTVWSYVKRLFSYREIVSLYIVDTFYRYQGGRSMFSDFFLNISHGAQLRRKAMEFKESMMSWNGHPDRLAEIIERFSIGKIHDTTVYCHCPKEECLIAYQVRQTIEKLMAKVKELDCQNRFLRDMLTVIPAGSIVDGSKIFLPNEFDFLIVFQHFDQPQFTSTESQINQVEAFRLLLIHSMQEMDRDLLEQREVNEPRLEFLFVDCELRRVCLNIRMIWRGAKYENLHLSIDLTPVFHFDGWADQHDGLRSLRPYEELPLWYRKVCQDTGYFRPVYNYITVPPFTPIAENRAIDVDTSNYGRVCLRLLKMVMQTDFLIENIHTPNSYCLKLALFLWCAPEENTLPERNSQIAGFVADIAGKFTGEWADKMPYLVTEGQLTTRFRFLYKDLLQVLQRHSHQPSPQFETVPVI